MLKHLGLGIAIGVVSYYSIPLAIGIIGMTAWEEYERYKVGKAMIDVINRLVEEDHPGLRHIVGDERVDNLRSRIK